MTILSNKSELLASRTQSYASHATLDFSQLFLDLRAIYGITVSRERDGPQYFSTSCCIISGTHCICSVRCELQIRGFP